MIVNVYLQVISVHWRTLRTFCVLFERQPRVTERSVSFMNSGLFRTKCMLHNIDACVCNNRFSCIVLQTNIFNVEIGFFA